jgi:hypothetical protein
LVARRWWLRGVAPVDAIRLSSRGLHEKHRAFPVGLIYLVASIVASIPFALGWLVLGLGADADVRVVQGRVRRFSTRCWPASRSTWPCVRGHCA